MTGKRFYMDKNGDLYDKDNGLLILDFGYAYNGINCKRLIDLLNNFHDENEQLKFQLDDCQTHKLFSRRELEKENEELKKITQELYDFRLVLNALLFNEWNENGKYEVYKSKKHSDGKLCFDGDWFIVVAILPSGQVTNHYHIKYWDYFKIPSYEKVKDKFDGHDSSSVLSRYRMILK